MHAMNFLQATKIFSVIELLDSKDFAEAMESIRNGLDQNPKPWFGLVEQNPEYQLVVK